MNYEHCKGSLLKRQTQRLQRSLLYSVNCLNLTLLLQIEPFYTSENSRKHIWLVLAVSGWFLLPPSTRMPAGSASARPCATVSSASKGGSSRLSARIKRSCRQSQYRFWTFGEFGRGAVHTLQLKCWTCTWGRVGAWILRKKVWPFPTVLRAVPFLCNITDVTSEPRGLCSKQLDRLNVHGNEQSFVVLYYTINS